MAKGHPKGCVFGILNCESFQKFDLAVQHQNSAAFKSKVHFGFLSCRGGEEFVSLYFAKGAEIRSIFNFGFHFAELSKNTRGIDVNVSLDD